MSSKAATREEDSVGRRLRLVLCAIGLHNWGRWEKVAVEHLGEYPWEKWRHICHADRRTCSCCGKNSRRRRCCQGPIKALPDQV